MISWPSGTSAASMTSTASMTSVASMASKASFHQNTYWAWCCQLLSHKMTYPGLSMWNISSKIHYFMGFWRFFCWRLWRPWMLLSTKSKGHKSKFRISWMYRYSYNNSKVPFWWPNKCLVLLRSSLNTLYFILQLAVTRTYQFKFQKKSWLFFFTYTYLWILNRFSEDS